MILLLLYFDGCAYSFSVNKHNVVLISISDDDDDDNNDDYDGGCVGAKAADECPCLNIYFLIEQTCSHRLQILHVALDRVQIVTSLEL